MSPGGARRAGRTPASQGPEHRTKLLLNTPVTSCDKLSQRAVLEGEASGKKWWGWPVPSSCQRARRARTRPLARV